MKYKTVLDAKDERYEQIGSVPLRLLQESSGVYSAIEEGLPLWYDYFAEDTFEPREQIMIQVLTRKRYRWEFKCEAEERKSSAHFFN